jgi:hypothetical protein
MSSSALKVQNNSSGLKRFRSNLPIDPVTGKFKRGPGRPPGKKTAYAATTLGKSHLAHVFDMLGGAKGMYDWARSDIKNLTIFYTQIFPKLLSAQSLDAAADKLSQRPQLTKIENVIVDPKNNYRSTMIDGEADEVVEQVEVVNDELERVRAEISRLMQEGGADEEPAQLISSQMPIE